MLEVVQHLPGPPRLVADGRGPQDFAEVMDVAGGVPEVEAADGRGAIPLREALTPGRTVGTEAHLRGPIQPPPLMAIQLSTHKV